MSNLVKLTNEQKCDISNSLKMWANYIETGDVVLTAEDAQNIDKKVRALNTEQMKRVVELRALVDSIYKSIYGSRVHDCD